MCLDAAALLSTSSLDLSHYPADFVTLSFYKIFGYPTGLLLFNFNRDVEKIRKKWRK